MPQNGKVQENNECCSGLYGEIICLIRERSEKIMSAVVVSMGKYFPQKGKVCKNMVHENDELLWLILENISLKRERSAKIRSAFSRPFPL